MNNRARVSIAILLLAGNLAGQKVKADIPGKWKIGKIDVSALPKERGQALLEKLLPNEGKVIDTKKFLQSAELDILVSKDEAAFWRNINRNTDPPEIDLVLETRAAQHSRLIREVAPVYPPEGRRSKVTSPVIFLIRVDPQGKVTHTLPIQGDSVFVPNCQEALMKWLFTPVLVDGKPVESFLSVEIKFQR